MHTILVENYPTVTSTKLYQEVIEGLKDKAESIQAAIRVHNANIRTYNVLRQSFFGQMFAHEEFLYKSFIPSFLDFAHGFLEKIPSYISKRTRKAESEETPKIVRDKKEPGKYFLCFKIGGFLGYGIP
jgi:hypothetical protein